jgi:ketosteroid isomerase-like protein
MAAMSETEIRNAEQACHALAIEYAEIVDTQEYERLHEIFAEDAIFARPTNVPEEIRGVENIVAMFTARPRNRLTHHVTTNIRVRVESPDTASGTSRVLLYTSDVSETETLEGRKTSGKQLMGTYRDRYVRTKNGWRFAERRGGISFHT